METHLIIKGLAFFVGPYNNVKDEILRQITLRNGLIVLPCSLHDLASASLYPELKNYYRRVDICTTDGTPLVWWATLQARQRVDRVYGPDLMKSILVDVQGDHFRHVFCGSSPVRLKSLVESIFKIAPKTHIMGTFTPTIHIKETKEEKECLQKVIDCRPSILWIGISSPKQVVLASRWKRYFPHTTIFCVGAALDLISGAIPVVPRWMQYLGLEWLFRLMVEPRRLYKRYLFLIPKFLLQEALIRLRGYFLF
ncbi:WecB/TagA/CpsF family glycosyltransferase [Candidatus Gottesmanbacteria bacterium]|nr:WecB/TagA/CpsF family glycosyltransferase [Candidatus Gottesmanbacteria bacterium]